MIPYLNTKHLDALKAQVLLVSGIKNLPPMGCQWISSLIIKQTKLAISETTLEKFYGFAMSRFHPSAYTLDTLSIYCGYESWAAFCLSQPKAGSSEHHLLSGLEKNATDTGKSADDLIDNPVISGLLETPVPTLMLRSNTPEFTILTYNEAYQDLTHPRSRDIVGLTLWEAFNAKNTEGCDPISLLESFHEAIAKQKIVHIKSLECDIHFTMPVITSSNWWDIRIIPVNFTGTVEYLIVNFTKIPNKVQR